MKRINVLIWRTIPTIKPYGGPDGYLYNIYNSLKNEVVENLNIDFLPTLNSKKTLRSKLYEFMYKRSKYFRYYYFQRLLFKSTNHRIDLSKYDFIHFHDTTSLFIARYDLEKFNGKVLLTTHSPLMPHIEIVDGFFINFDEIKKKKLQYNLKLIDEYSFLRADKLIFPCESAKEPYIKESFFNNFNIKYPQKFAYLPTGSVLCLPQISSSEFKSKYNIPNDAFLISYVGRHNEVKGYDILKKIGEYVLSNNKDVYFVIAGLEAPIKGLKHKNWIEIGFTNDPHSLISASDLFILPNRETYFDLILLETLSLNTPVLLAETGGNKYFKKFKDKDIYFFNTFDMACICIDEIISNKQKFNNNKDVFLENFTMNVFLKNYSLLLNEL